MKLLNAMATVGGLTGLSRILGFIRDILTAAILGAGPIADAFFVALKLPNFFRRVTAEGAFSVAFIPIYTEIVEKQGQERASQFASNAFSVMMIFLIPFSVLAMILMPFIIDVIAPGFQNDALRYDTAVELSRITFPYLLMMSLTALLGGVLNAHNKFYPFASAPIFFNICMIFALLFFTKFTETAGHALSWGIFVSGFVQFFWLVYFTKKLGIRVRIKRPEFTANIKKLFKLMGPGVIGAGVMHINLFADMIIASLLASGSISYLYYADRLNQLPLGMVGIAVGTALLPMLSRTIAAGNEAQTNNLFNRALEICLMLALPAAAALFVIPETLIGTLFERGEFTQADTLVAAKALMGYSIGLPAYVVVKVLSTAYWSRQDTKSPVKISIFVALLNVALCLIFIQFMGVAGIAFATGCVAWVQLGLLYKGIRSNSMFAFDDRFKKVAFKILFSVVLMSAFLLAIDKYMPMMFTHELKKILALCIIVGGGGFVYVASIFGTKAIALGDLKRYLSRTKKV